MLGQIIPAPLAIPVITQVCPPRSSETLRNLARVSVVKIAAAARSQLLSQRSSTARGNARVISSAESGSPITPVENGRTRSLADPVKSATAWQDSIATLFPCSPVPALALPVLTNNQSASPWFALLCSAAISTGAARNAFWVKTTEVLEPDANEISTTSS